MLYVCTVRFDMTRNLKKFLIFGAKQFHSGCTRCRLRSLEGSSGEMAWNFGRVS